MVSVTYITFVVLTVVCFGKIESDILEDVSTNIMDDVYDDVEQPTSRCPDYKGGRCGFYRYGGKRDAEERQGLRVETILKQLLEQSRKNPESDDDFVGAILEEIPTDDVIFEELPTENVIY